MHEVGHVALHLQYWQTPLLIAAIKGNTEMMEELLKAKADPNLVSKVHIIIILPYTIRRCAYLLLVFSKVFFPPHIGWSWFITTYVGFCRRQT